MSGVVGVGMGVVVLTTIITDKDYIFEALDIVHVRLQDTQTKGIGDLASHEVPVGLHTHGVVMFVVCKVKDGGYLIVDNMG